MLEAPASACRQRRQKRAEVLLTVPQSGHARPNSVPQLSQKRASSRFECLHIWHSINLRSPGAALHERPLSGAPAAMSRPLGRGRWVGAAGSGPLGRGRWVGGAGLGR